MIDPAPLAIDIPVPAVRVARVNPLAPSLPMRSCPSVTVDASTPVPPFDTPRVFDT